MCNAHYAHYKWLCLHAFNHSGIIPDHFKCPDPINNQGTWHDTSDIGATGITSPCQIIIKERATKPTPLKVNMMEHKHWGLEDHFPGWFLGSIWIFQGVPVHKIVLEFKVLPTLELKTPAPRSDQNVNGPEASKKTFLNTSQNPWKGSFMLKSCLFEIGHRKYMKIPQKFVPKFSPYPPQEWSH